ncbi:MAG: hypothetical protein FH756_14420 [Firmicutes bacterium]|nr:hypothetical protein [Bacillota bacterium]
MSNNTEQFSFAANYSGVPLGFEVNHGQTAPEVQYLVRGYGYTLFLAQGEAKTVTSRDKNYRVSHEIGGR